jgi:glycolate oxidase FAD binding subunit
VIEPSSIEELAAALRDAGVNRKTVNVLGNNSKRLMAGPLVASDVTISTARLNRILDYEPRDLTISVEAGMPYADLRRTLAENGQMIPLDPPYAEQSTIGGVVSANVSGPRRRLHGTARDMVIGMKFVTLEGQIVQSGGMVVKNVAGLDMAKMMIGSFGTLAAIGVVNFKLLPLPPETRSFVQEFSTVQDVMAARDRIHTGQLQPAALDIVKSDGKYQLLVQGGGNRAVLDRYTRELDGATALDGDAEERLWAEVREYTPSFLSANPNGAVVRASCNLTEVGKVLDSFPGRALARAGSGICYGYFEKWGDAIGRGVVEYAADDARTDSILWPSPGSDFEIMKKVKDMFDPQHLLNRGRLYGRI